MVTARQPAMGEITTLLGRGASFEGKLTFEGAEVEAEIDIGEVIIQGTVVGNVKAKRSIEIHAPGRVKGDLHTPVLQVDKGVVFEGRSFMEASLGGGSKPQPPPAKPSVPTPVK